MLNADGIEIEVLAHSSLAWSSGHAGSVCFGDKTTKHTETV